LHIIPFTNTLQAAGAEDRSLLGSKLSADSGAKTRLGLTEPRPRTRFTGIGRNAINPRGLGTCVREDLMDLLIERNQLG
jgi:hypothetical protein